MTDSSPTVWPMTDHTRAKHAILQGYLQAWLWILTRQAAKLAGRSGRAANRRVLFIDGFAGPGVYEGGEPGSPVIAIRTAVAHPDKFPALVEMQFVEARKDRLDRLREVLVPEVESVQKRDDVRVLSPVLGDCDSVLKSLLDDHEDRGLKFGPALAFLDQFGYGAVSMSLIGRILRLPQCETFTYLNYREMNRWLIDPDKEPGFDRAFGGPEWRECRKLPEAQRRSRLLDLYKEALRTRGGAKYATSFLMFDHNDRPLYWLIFCTNHIRGLEKMKESMWKVDGTGGFKFSDHDDPSQLRLLADSFDQEWLAEELRTKLRGQTMSAAKIVEYVLTNTPCYRFRDALKKLETEGAISIVKQPPKRRPCTFPDEKLDQIEVQFARRLF